MRIIKNVNLINLEFEVNEKLDKSGLGANMQIMTSEDKIDEAFNFYPGIAAVKNGYIPFATCLAGSGDSYFVNEDSNKITE